MLVSDHMAEKNRVGRSGFKFFFFEFFFYQSLSVLEKHVSEASICLITGLLLCLLSLDENKTPQNQHMNI